MRKGALNMAQATHPSVTPTVLVVDDDPMVREMAQTSLLRAGYRVLVARDGGEALERLRELAPDLILTDVFMPNLDGIELLAATRGRADGPPVIAMSGGYAGIDMLDATTAMGASATLHKPFRPRELTDLVARLLVGPPRAHAAAR
jgi:CheY-like chemotaxis protein